MLNYSRRKIEKISAYFFVLKSKNKKLKTKISVVKFNKNKLQKICYFLAIFQNLLYDI